MEKMARPRNAAIALIPASMATVVTVTTAAATGLDRRVAINNLGSDTSISTVQISHVDVPYWLDDLLGPRFNSSGEHLWVEQRRPQGYCLYDVRVTFANDPERRMTDVNLREFCAIEVDYRGATKMVCKLSGAQHTLARRTISINSQIYGA